MKKISDFFYYTLGGLWLRYQSWKDFNITIRFPKKNKEDKK